MESYYRLSDCQNLKFFDRSISNLRLLLISIQIIKCVLVMIFSLSVYENPVAIVIIMLKLLKVKVTDKSVNNVIKSHPNYPSLLSISDSLKHWKVDNIAIRAQKEKLEEIPLPFIVIMDSNFHIITHIGENDIFLLNDSNKNYKENRKKFVDTWNGIALIAESSGNIQEKNYAQKKLNEMKQHAKTPILILFGFLCIIISTLFSGRENNFSSLFWAALLLSKLMGIIVTALLLWHQIDNQNLILKKICAIGKKESDCHVILGSKHAKIFSWLTLSEVGFYYFTGSFLVLNLYPEHAHIIAWLNVFSLPFVFFSLWYQKFKAKQWCILCLIVVLLLSAEFVLSVFNGLLYFPLSINNTLFQIAFVFSLPVIIWMFSKSYFINAKKAEFLGYELRRLKSDAEIFDAILQRQKKITFSTDGLGITLGKPTAKNTIVKVCSPYCDPCSKMHPEIERLLTEKDDLKVQIIFTATNKLDDISANPVRHLLTIAEANDESFIKKALDDWYLPENKDYQSFASKYPIKEDLYIQSYKIDLMNLWCQRLDISFTPTIFVNGYQLPELYNIKDLTYVLD